MTVYPVSSVRVAVHALDLVVDLYRLLCSRLCFAGWRHEQQVKVVGPLKAVKAAHVAAHVERPVLVTAVGRHGERVLISLVIVTLCDSLNKLATHINYNMCQIGVFVSMYFCLQSDSEAVAEGL